LAEHCGLINFLRKDLNAKLSRILEKEIACCQGLVVRCRIRLQFLNMGYFYSKILIQQQTTEKGRQTTDHLNIDDILAQTNLNQNSGRVYETTV
jgi:hypothetical protein